MDIRAYNRDAWNKQVEAGNRWTVPVTPEEIAAARRGEWSLVLTPTKIVPREWYPPISGCDVLCLASGGGQQGPILAAAGANVTVLDNSPRQLERDRQVAEREGLTIRTLEGDMRDLSVFADASFDLVFHPVSNIFVDDILVVWREAYRVLRPGGVLLAGIVNPTNYIFDADQLDAGVIELRHTLPYSDVESLSVEKRKEYEENGSPLEWSHSFEEQLGGQMQAGFHMVGFFEDRDPESPLYAWMPTFFATRAVKG